MHKLKTYLRKHNSPTAALPAYEQAAVCDTLSIYPDEHLGPLIFTQDFMQDQSEETNSRIPFLLPCETEVSEEAHEKNFVEQPARAMKSCLQTQFGKLSCIKKKKKTALFFYGRGTERCGTGCSVVKRGQVSRSCLASLQTCLICFIFEIDLF